MDKVVIAMYLRLSNEDINKAKSEESNSISAQRVLLTRHIELLMQGQAYSIVEFCDDGYTGTDFNRPGFQTMIEAAKSGKISMIIVKDFSRFGRDYLEVGRYLEYIFPILQIRFVSVNDNYDSSDKLGATGGMSVALKNIVYAMYSDDLSKKVRSARNTRVRNGEFVGQFAPYGYMKNPKDKHELLIDETAACVVRKVFCMAADGVSHSEIARRLNEEEIPTRYMYHRLKGDNFPDKQPHVKIKKWDSTMIKDIISNFFVPYLTRADFYLLHSVEDGGHYDTYEKYDCFNWAIQKKAEGKIKHFGFSYHGSPELLEKVLDKHPETEFVQIQLNYADWNNPVVRSGEIYEILHRRNIPMIIMEPVKGGTLASLKPELEAKYKAVSPVASIASWAFRFVGSLPGVMTILSGMSNEEQVQDNIKTFIDFEPLSARERAVVDEVTAIMLDIPQIGCTACRYCCDGCPMKISIPDVFRTVNTMRLYHEEFRPKAFYNGLVGSSGRASACIACGQCEGVCPQHLPIIELMKESAALLDA